MFLTYTAWSHRDLYLFNFFVLLLVLDHLCFKSFVLITFPRPNQITISFVAFFTFFKTTKIFVGIDNKIKIQFIFNITRKVA